MAKQNTQKKSDQFKQAVLLKKAVLEVISQLMETLDGEMTSATTDYRIIGKSEEQAKDWKTGELRWADEEHTVPYYEDKWGRVPLTEEEMTPDVLAKVDAINMIAEALTKLA